MISTWFARTLWPLALSLIVVLAGCGGVATITSSQEPRDQESATTKLHLQGSVDEDLITAAREGDRVKVEEMLAARVDPNAKTDNGFTALMGAAQNGHTEVANALLAAKANPNAGMTAPCANMTCDTSGS